MIHQLTRNSDHRNRDLKISGLFQNKPHYCHTQRSLNYPVLSTSLYHLNMIIQFSFHLSPIGNLLKSIQWCHCPQNVKMIIFGVIVFTPPSSPHWLFFKPPVL